MHTYRISDAGDTWEVGFVTNAKFDWIGRRFGSEAEAAAFASFLNGGRYNPHEIEAVFAVKTEPDDDDDDDDDSIHPDRPAALEDYPVKRAHK